MEIEEIWQSPRLPSLPSVAVELLELSKSEDSTLADFTALIKSDPAMSIKILKAVNSPKFGLKSDINTIDRAVSLLGRNRVATLALSFCLSPNAHPTGNMAEQYSRFWLQSLVQATTSEYVAERLGVNADVDYFLSGLLLDIGQLAMLKVIPDRYWQIFELAYDAGEAIEELEQQSLGFDHIEIGTKMLEHWGMPVALVNAIKSHHLTVDSLGESKDIDAISSFSAATGDYFVSQRSGLALEKLQRLANVCFGWTKKTLDEVLIHVEERTQEAGEIMSIETNQLRPASEIMSIAMDQLAMVALAN